MLPLAIGVPTKESKGKGLFGPNGGRGEKVEVGFDNFGGGGEEVGNCGGNGGRGSSIFGRGGGSLAICSMESKDGLGCRELVVIGGRSSSVSKRVMSDCTFSGDLSFCVSTEYYITSVYSLVG
ncbi:hypothetical protein Tco_0411889 [Tanacetum coccineum]